ncbi:MAG: protein-L-isoaspartate O-methyltransferase, partial [Chloroflexota bacterium]|nr:protein-L-isoaspartate O-methyltransferase [Chloroflexota bacterium]
SLSPSLIAQLTVGGRMVVPVGDRDQQELICVLRTGEGVSLRMLGPCRFVPLLGREAFPTSL